MFKRVNKTKINKIMKEQDIEALEKEFIDLIEKDTSYGKVPLDKQTFRNVYTEPERVLLETILQALTIALFGTDTLEEGQVDYFLNEDSVGVEWSIEKQRLLSPIGDIQSTTYETHRFVIGAGCIILTDKPHNGFISSVQSPTVQRIRNFLAETGFLFGEFVDDIGMHELKERMYK